MTLTSLSSDQTAAMAERIKSGEAAAVEEFYRMVSAAFGPTLCWQFGRQDLKDKVHDVFVAVVGVVRNGGLREPAALFGLVKTIAARQSAHFVERLGRRRHTEVQLDFPVIDREARDPESLALAHEREMIARRALDALHARDREVLVRFFLKGQSADEIQRDLKLTPRQFQQTKWRAKERIAGIGRELLCRR